MDELKLRQMIIFHLNATKATYAGSSGNADSQRQGFTELEHKEEPWYYRDSYTGFLRSWGQEVIYLLGAPVWTNIYGGGMEPGYMSQDFASQTFAFLKRALSYSKTHDVFCPRGPDSFSQDNWVYSCSWHGEMANFSGHESIAHKGEPVFRHQFAGGLIVGRE